MLKKIIATLFITILICFGLSAQEMTHADSLNTALEKYYSLNIKIFQSNSTVSDIDELFEIFTEDFTYIHAKYGGTYTREDLYNGYVRNQKSGGYDGSVVDITVVNKISGLNAIAVEKRYIEKGENGEPVDGEGQMALFEFREGKISRITEFW